jgi:MFS family permease
MWWAEASPAQRRSLVAASLGWMLDSMDILLYSMVLTHLMRDLGMREGLAGLLNSLTLAASAVGGIVFGFIADRVGRVRALTASILVYSVFTAACGLSGTVLQLAVFRVVLGLGMGGEWACGAALVAETWGARHRGKALGIMQSSWAVGYGLAAALTALVLPHWGWRAVFFAGIAPALVTFWIRRSIPEPEIWLRHKAQPAFSSVLSEMARLWHGTHRRHLLVATAANAGTMFAWWGLFTWIPAFLSLPAERGGAGLDIVRTSSWIIVMQSGMWLGYVSFGFISDRFGRKRTYVAYIFAAAAVVPLYASTRDPLLLLLVGPLVGFFGTGYFSGFGAITAELFPTPVRAAAQGLTYNLGRGLSAAAPLVVGVLGAERGLGSALLLTSGAFLAAGLIALLLPETRGLELDGGAETVP